MHKKGVMIVLNDKLLEEIWKARKKIPNSTQKVEL